MPVFIWHDVGIPGRFFRIQLSLDSSFASFVFNEESDDTIFYPLANIGPDSIYFWRVKHYMPDASDSSTWSAIWSFRKDTQAPGAPPNLRADGQSPSPWEQDSIFTATCDTAGLDASGITGFYWKNGSRPTSGSDFTGFNDVMEVTALTQGGESLFVWCLDGAGNANYQNVAWTLLRWDQTSPEAVVHVPNGTEVWTAGEIRNITWAHFDSCVIAFDSLYYSTDGGAAWTPIGRVYPPDTMKVWSVPSTPSTACRVKVVVRDSAGNRIEDISNNNFTIVPATTPTLAVDFTTWNPPPEGRDTTLHVYNSGDAVVIPFLVSADSAWLWPTPDSGATPADIGLHVDANYTGLVRTGHIVVTAPGFNGSPQTVTITQASLDTVDPWANITNPTPGMTKYCGTTLNITWNEGDNVGVVQDSLEYSLDGGGSWTFITKGPIPANGHVWPVPNTPTAAAQVRVIVTDSAGNTGQGVSGLFTIADSTRPTVSVTMPFIGVVWPTGSTQAIMWNQSDNVGVVRDSVVFSSDFGASWQQVYAGPATSMFQWSVPHVHSANCYIKVIATDSSGNQGQNTSGAFQIQDTIPPQVTAIVSPAAGAVWGIGTVREISWQQQDNVSIGYDSLLYSTDGGGSWSHIDNVSSVASYQWTVPGPASASCRVKVVARDVGGNLGELASGLFEMADATNPFLSVAPLSMSLAAAGGSDSVAVTNSGNDSVFAYTVACDSAWIGLSSAGGSTPGGFRVSADSNNSGVFRSALVMVAAAGIPGSPDTVLVGQAALDLAAPACTLHAPNGGEALDVGAQYRIRWFQADAGGVARDTLMYTSNGGGSWNFVWTGLDTSYLWTVPNTPSASCAVRLIARDSSGNRALDNSDAFFSISDGAAPIVTVGEALSGAGLYCGSQYNLQWAQNDNIAVTGDSVYLSTDNQASWVPVAGLPPSTSHLWTVPHSPSINCFIKVVAWDGAGNKGWDANNYAFSIIDTLRPTVELVSPNGGENWYGGTVHAISWNQSDNVGIAGDSLFYSADNGASWAFIDTASGPSYPWTVPSALTSQGRVRVVAWDASGNRSSDISQAAFTINQTDVVAPRLYCGIADTARMTYGSDFTFRVHANDNSGIAKVRLYWRPGGSAAAPDSAQMYNFPPDTQYVYPLPAAQIPLQGLSYRLAAWDSAGNSVSYPAVGYKLHSVYLSQLAMSGAYVYDKWKMVSFPADIGQRAVANLLTDDLGAYDIYKWRLYEYQADHYVEHGDAAFRPGAAGRAYWLRQKVGSAVTLDAENLATTTSADSAVSIPLVAQWTDVGNPFLFPVNWADVRAATGADTSKILGVYTYSGDGWVFPVTGQMSPWEGYCLRVSSAGTLRIPMKAAKTSDPKDSGWPEGWRGTVTVTGGGKRDDNYFGVGTGTSAGLDKYDYPEPPSGLTKISGWFEVEGQDCGADLRPSLGEGQAWAFSTTGREGDLALTVDVPSEILKGKSCFWADLAEGMYEEVGPGFCYRYRSVSADERRDFQLILGTPEFAQAELDRSLTAPRATALLQNRPNPFGENTEIRYHLASPGRVRITVYNVIGQQVRTLVDSEKRTGRYRAVWDGRDNCGRKLGSGVYLCRLDAGGTSLTIRMTLLR